MEIEIMHRQGKSLKQIVRETGYSINTVRKYLRSHQEPRYKRRPGKAQKLDPYRDYLQERIAQAKPHWLAATVLYREIVALGYDGSPSLLRAYLHTLKPAVKEQPVVRFETEAGKQMQVDFASFNQAGQRFYAFVALLGYSRALFVEFVSDQQLLTLLACHEHAFAYFGGVPKQVLYDNMKTVIITRDAYGKGLHRLSAGFYDFAKHYGFIPKMCQPYRPQTKGKVERAIRYLRESFYIPFVSRYPQRPISLAAINQSLCVWLDTVANQRIHARLKEQPATLLRQEQPALQPLLSWHKRLMVQQLACSSVERALPTYDGASLQHPLSLYQALLGETS